MTTADTSGVRAALTDEQRARVQRAVDAACTEIERETAAIVLAFRAMADAERARQRVVRMLAIIAAGVVLCAVVLAVLWLLGRLAVVIGGAL